MRVARAQIDGDPRPVLIKDGGATPIRSDISFQSILTRVKEGIDIPVSGSRYDLTDLSLLPPVESGNNFYGVAENFKNKEQVEDFGQSERPIVFIKPYQSLIGNRELIQISDGPSDHMFLEGELAVVIGESAWKITTENAFSIIAGFTIVNDITAKDFENMKIDDRDSIDWFSAKCIRQTTPIGPHIVPKDEIPEPQSLTIKSKLNNRIMQDSSTESMVHTIADIISYLSSRVELKPGDIISTGTPGGVEAFQDERLQPGDFVEISIGNIGSLKNDVA